MYTSIQFSKMDHGHGHNKMDFSFTKNSINVCTKSPPRIDMKYPTPLFSLLLSHDFKKEIEKKDDRHIELQARLF